jgi:hypothetical protein
MEFPGISAERKWLVYLHNEEETNTYITKTTQNVRMYILLDTDKDYDLLCNRPILSTNRTTHAMITKTVTVLTATKIWPRVPDGLDAKMA